jgi:hypothetical protein
MLKIINVARVSFEELKGRIQRVLNNSWRTRLSRRRMIGSPPPSPVSKLARRHAGRLRKRDSLLAREGGGGGGAESYIDEKAWSS